MDKEQEIYVCAVAIGASVITLLGCLFIVCF